MITLDLTTTMQELQIGGTRHAAPAAGTDSVIEKTPLERYVAPARPSLIGLSRAELIEALASIGVPERERRMRAQQLWHWLYLRGATSFEVMTSISKTVRAALQERFTLARPEVVAEQVSVDGTRKWLLRLPGELAARPHEVECVYIPDTDRGTLCVSSQVGCTLNCSFCHTGTQRLVRNLTAGEIVGQVMVARDRLGDCARRARDRRRRRRHRYLQAQDHAVDVWRRP
jgi:23S rRNA (adenine2503-C2)-methyltransferase